MATLDFISVTVSLGGFVPLTRNKVMVLHLAFQSKRSVTSAFGDCSTIWSTFTVFVVLVVIRVWCGTYDRLMGFASVVSIRMKRQKLPPDSILDSLKQLCLFNSLRR